MSPCNLKYFPSAKASSSKCVASSAHLSEIVGDESVGVRKGYYAVAVRCDFLCIIRKKSWGW
jgi:hypothetical protein